ncbi:hypothetical protein OEZ60_01715 [Defluviimonas sp. WL0024]|uniref:Uncharacterized protein n=1 Tax=Albidovulum salinarum TaxID=2984153 RepID=A0ABT2WYG9_9RHOB|nr:hypothetical protein [Defluviimonas sp. WL0024]MCU9846717.1 hypothetical protein [Defluviimonas sp. WL0024]
MVVQNQIRFLVLLISLSAPAPVAAQTLSPEDVEKFVAGSMRTCVPGTTERMISEGADADRASLFATEYCRCTGASLAASMNRQDIELFEAEGRYPEAVINRVPGISLACYQYAVELLGDPRLN